MSLDGEVDREVKPGMIRLGGDFTEFFMKCYVWHNSDLIDMAMTPPPRVPVQATYEKYALWKELKKSSKNIDHHTEIMI